MKKQKGWMQRTFAGIMCVMIGAGMAGSYWCSNGQTVSAEELTELISEAEQEEGTVDIGTDSFEEAAVSDIIPDIFGEDTSSDAMSDISGEEMIPNTSEEELPTDIVTEDITETELTDIESEETEDLSIEDEAVSEPEEVTDEVPEPVTAMVTTWKSPREFVSRLYEIFLGRPADTSGLEFWTGKLERQEIGAANVAYSIIFSTESRQSSMTDEEFCQSAYALSYNEKIERVTGSDIDVYIRYLQQGFSREFVLRDMTDWSFSLLCKDYGMLAGRINVQQPRDQNVELTRFVNRLYTEALGRPGEEGGLNYWCDGLMNKGFSPYTVANYFINSPEFTNKNLSNEEYVKTLYRTFFGREYDMEGLNFWMGRLATGTSKAYVLNFFEHSWEFFEIVSYFGVRSEAELWIDERNLILNSIADQRAKAAILYALDRKGYPYSQELRNTGAYFDCSSLVYYSWQYAGVDLRYRGSNTAASIAEGLVASGKQIHPASLRDLQPGDLIFTTGGNNGRYMGITHVAMYMGSGRVIETPVIEHIGDTAGVGRTYMDDSGLKYRVENMGYIICRP